ncbi:MAG: aspartate/glutamate racemase family protein [Acetobacteraceae bacterium]|nr:aspartate/glutamate racemase family protein [Acetobacteraceae bacterium]
MPGCSSAPAFLAGPPRPSARGSRLTAPPRAADRARCASFSSTPTPPRRSPLPAPRRRDGRPPPAPRSFPLTARFGPAVIANRAENAVAAHAVLDLLGEHGEGADAVLLAVSFDTGLAAARETLSIPVVGMTEAACLFACALGGRFGLISFSSAAMYRELVAGYGLGARLAGIALIELDAGRSRPPSPRQSRAR